MGREPDTLGFSGYNTYKYGLEIFVLKAPDFDWDMSEPLFCL